MSWIRIKKLTKTFEAGNTTQIVFRDINFRLNKGDRVGVIGANGTGKTTLIKLILNQIDPDDGQVEATDGIRLGYFSQFSELSGEFSVLEELDNLFEDVHSTERALATIADDLSGASDEDMTRLLEEQAALFETVEQLDGWNYENKIDIVLTKLGFSDDHRLAPINELSGGWRNRAALAQLLLQAPDVLLMDEPTNYLDVAGLSWLEDWFRKFDGALLVVSHDRDFLDAVATKIIEVENHGLQVYEGNYSDYVPKKHFRFKSLERAFIHEQEMLVYEQEAISDRSRNRKLANIKKSKTKRPVDQIVTEIYQHLHVAKELCEVEGVSKSYRGQTLFAGLDLELRRGDRLAIVGPNGCGKSTLLGVLSGLVEPDSGRVRWRKGANPISYNDVLDHLDLNDTLSHAVNSMPNSLALAATRKSVNRFLALFQFSEMDLKQRLGDLSGGQRARVALIMCLLSGSPVILLDEPTNHLDLASAQVMERALLHFPGSLIVVSHDRFFLDKVATTTMTFLGDGAVVNTPVTP